MKTIKINPNRWFCKEHGLEGVVGRDWCFGCYRLMEDGGIEGLPVPHHNYNPINKEENKLITFLKEGYYEKNNDDSSRIHPNLWYLFTYTRL